MEKDIGKIRKNDETDIIIRVDDFGGSPGLTIREFVQSEGYTGFTKAGVRIKSDKFEEFKTLINSIDPADLAESAQKTPTQTEPASTKEDDAGIDQEGLM